MIKLESVYILRKLVSPRKIVCRP